MKHWKLALVGALGLAIGLSYSAFATHPTPTATPTPEIVRPAQPTLHKVGSYRGGYLDLYWFEQGDTECYLADQYDRRAGTGISCLRKAVP